MKDTSNKKMHEQNQTELELIGGSFSLDNGENEIKNIKSNLSIKAEKRRILVTEVKKKQMDEFCNILEKLSLLLGDNPFIQTVSKNPELYKSICPDEDILKALKYILNADWTFSWHSKLSDDKVKELISKFRKLDIKHQFGLLCIQASNYGNKYRDERHKPYPVHPFIGEYPDGLWTSCDPLFYDDNFKSAWLEFVGLFNWTDKFYPITLLGSKDNSNYFYTPYHFSSIEVLNKHLKKILGMATSGKFIPLGGYPWVYWKNSEFVLTIAENNLDHLINCAPPHFHKNKELHLKILAKYPEYYFKMKNRNLKKDKEIIKVTVRTKPELLKKMVETNFKFFQKFNPFTLTALIEKTGKKIKNFDSFFEKIWHERYK